MRVLLAALTVTCAWGQLDRPMLGMMVDSSGSARPLFGLPGSLSVGDPAATGVLSSACSATLCLIKTDAAIVSQGQSIAAPAGRALFAFFETGAYIYFPESKQLAHWHDGQLDPADFDVAGEVLSIRAGSGIVEFAVRRGFGIWIVRSGNAVVEAMPRDTQNIMLLDQGILFATREAMVLRRPDASSIRFPLAHTKSFAALGSGYVQIRAAGSVYALRVDAGREQLFLLPEPQQ
jgi:hypothetical protein